MTMFSFDERFALFDMTPLENQFILNYLPDAPENAVRVYIYGLMACHHPDAQSDLEGVARELHLTQDEVRAAYRYWERKGLVHRVADQPPQYRYVSVSQVCMLGAQTQTDPAYEAFAEALYGVFDNDRRLHGGEISQCYEWVEQMNLPQEVVIELMRYMMKKSGKGFSIRAAEKWAVKLAEEKVQTVEDAQALFARDQTIWRGSRDVLSKLGQRRNPSEPEQALYRKWLTEWHFTPEAILKACDESVRSINPTFVYIDGILKRLHDQENITTAAQVEQDFAENQENAEPLKAVLRVLNQPGLNINDTTLGAYRAFHALYPDAIVMMAAQECAKRGKSSLEAIQQTLMTWKNSGLETVQEVEAFMQEVNRLNEMLITLYQVMGVDETPNAADRRLLSRWLDEWKLSFTFIVGCAAWASGKKNGMTYLNGTLKKLREKGIVTLEAANADHEAFAAKKTDEQQRQGKVVGEQLYDQRTYTNNEDAMDELMRKWQEAGNA